MASDVNTLPSLVALVESSIESMKFKLDWNQWKGAVKNKKQTTMSTVLFWEIPKLATVGEDIEKNHNLKWHVSA